MRIFIFAITAILSTHAHADEDVVLQRLHGLWGNSRAGCALYTSGALAKANVDVSTLRSFGLVEFNGKSIDYKFQAAKCEIKAAGAMKDYQSLMEVYCDVKGQKGLDLMLVKFIGDGDIEIRYTGDFFDGDSTLTKCSN